MKIRELQDEIRDFLNGVESLVQGGCKAFSEDTLDIETTVRSQVQTSAGVALVVTTPDFTRNGCSADGLPAEAQIVIRCIEAPSINRKKSGHLTALDAAEIVASELDEDLSGFQRIEQRGDERTGTVTASVTFNVSVKLT